jgi:protein-disulfide isomerase/plastocyanin
MKEFINRNKPVFVIGIVTALVFLVIIFLAQKNVTAGPTLRKIDNVNFIESYTFTKGPAKPVITLVEFSDFECPACKEFQPVVSSLYTKYSPYMQLVFRNFPLPQHTDAKSAAIAAQAAGQQGKFWEYADKLFENQPNFTPDELASYAEELGLDVEKFKTDLNDPKIAQDIENDIQTGNKIGLTGTPSFVLDSNLVQINSPDDLEKAIISELKKANVTISSAQTPATQTAQSTESSGSTGNQTVTPTGQVVTITYTDNGFDPNNLKLKLGTTVKFVNAVNRDIVIRQLMDKYAEFREIKIIKQGQSFQFTLSQKDLWTFKEDSARHYGSIFVSE